MKVPDIDAELETIELGHNYSFTDLTNKFTSVFGGVSWPSKRPGCCVVIGMGRMQHNIFLLDEFETFDLRRLVIQCKAFDQKYYISSNNDYRRSRVPDRWIGDGKANAARRLISELNKEYEGVDSDIEGMPRPRFHLNSTPILDMGALYQYILPQIKELITDERRQLYLKDSIILNYLSEIEESEIATLESGSYPAVEALAFAVIQMTNCIRSYEQRSNRPNHKRRYNPLYPRRKWNVLH